MKHKLLLLFILPMLIGQNLLAAPIISSFSPASGAVGTLVTITGTGLSTPTAFSIGGKPAIVISNTGTKLVGMIMPGAVTGTVTVTTSSGTATSATNFTLVATPKPTIQQGNKLTDPSTDPSLEVGIGGRVVVSADGNTAAVSGYETDGGDIGVGFVDVYVRQNNLWSLQGYRLAHAFYAYSNVSDIAISADGNLITAGYSSDAQGQGSIWTFRRTGTTWTTMDENDQFLGSGGSISSNQGSAVALSADGTTLVESGTGDNGNQGAIWVFKYNGSKWIQQGAKITISNNIGAAAFGSRIAVSSDGKTILASGPNDNGGTGATWVFVLNGTTWVQQAKLIGTGAVAGAAGNARQGLSLAINADGNTAVVGGQLDNNRKGALWVFTRTGTTWTQQGSKLIANAPSDVIFQGNTVSVTADGNTIIEGGASPTSKTGLAWLFTRTGNTWAQSGSAFSVAGAADKPDGTTNYYHTVAISADGTTAIIDAPSDGKSGAVFPFSIVNTSPVISSVSPSSGPAGTLATITGSNMAGTSSVTIGGKPAIILTNTSTQLVAMVMPGAVTGNISIVAPGGTGMGGNFTVTPAYYPVGQQSAKLVGSGAVGLGEQGTSVAVSADGKTAVVGAWKDNNNRGAIWIYTRSGNQWTQQGAKLVGTGATGSALLFGRSVAINADGNTVVVGAPGNNSTQGGIWFFARSGGVWSQQGVGGFAGPTSGAGPGQQGSSVALSADGNTAVMGGPGDDGQIGAIWFFKRSAGKWSLMSGRIQPLGATGPAQYGGSLAMSADGLTVVVGGSHDNNNQGAVWMLTLRDIGWIQSGDKLVGTGSIGASLQGLSVALNADGSTVVVGGNADNGQQGAAWVFYRAPATASWIQQGNKLLGTGVVGAARQGSSVGVSADGSVVISGGLGDNNFAGAFWTFKNNGSAWQQQGTKLTGTGGVGATHIEQGISIALSADGGTALTGGTGDNGGVGAVWPFYNKITPVITFPQPPAVMYGVADIAPGATSTNATIPITYTSSDTTIATIVNNKVHIKAAGITKITAIQLGNADYGTVSVPHFLTINKAALTITADDKLGTAGAALPALTATYTGFVYGETSANLITKPVLSTTGTSSSPIGTYPITASGAASNNYTITYKPGTLSLRSSSLTPQTITYNQVSSVRYGVADAAPDATSTNNTIPLTFTSSDTTVATIINGKIHIKKLGVVKITAMQSGDLYYSAAPPVAHYITVVKALLTITADNKSSIASQPVPALTITYTGFVNGETAANLTTQPTISTTATNSSPAGTYPITVGGATADNYNITFKNGTLTLAPVPPPVISSFSPTVVPTGGLVTITGTDFGYATSFMVSGKAGVIVSKTSNKLVGLVMPGSVAGKITVSNVSGTATSTGNIAIAPNPVPNSQQGNKLIGTGGIGTPTQGNAIASSADGTTIVVGGSYDNNGMGAVWVYTRSGTDYVQQGTKLIGTGGTGPNQLQQGTSVAINADGNTIIIGAPGDNNNVGAVWIFTRTGTTWTQQGTRLTGTGSEGAARMGYSVAISADGNTAIAGAYNDNGNIGAAWVFTRQNGVWTQQGSKLKANDSYGQSAQGVSVAMSADGNTAVVGATADFNNIGGAWVYRRTGTTWAQQGSKLMGTGAVGQSAQGNVAISADATTIMLGGYADNGNKGAGWIFTFNGTGWSQQGAKLVGTGTITADQQGRSVALSVDGNTAVIGGPGGTKGATWVFTRSGSTWTQRSGMLLGAGSSNGAGQGSAVAISTNGRAIFIGAPYDNGNHGAVWNFVPAAKASQTIDTFQTLAPVNYGAPDIQLVATSTNTTIPVTFSSSDTTIAVITAAQKVHIRKGGSVTITASQAGNANYSDAVPVSQVLVINKAPLVVYANNKTVRQGFSSVSYSATYQGFLNGDTTSSFTAQPVFSTTATGASLPGQYPITVSGAVSPNYTFTYSQGILTVEPVQAPPQITSFSPKTGTVGTLVTINGSNLYAPSVFTIGGKPAAVISNTGTRLVGMVMPGAVNGPITLSTDTGSTSASGNFTVSATSYPSSLQNSDLHGTGSVGSSLQGSDIALSADGNTAIVGGSGDNGGIGAAWIYVRNGTSWEQQGNKLVGSGSIGAANQGTTVAISADGNTAVIGAPRDNGFIGAAWVFVRDQGTWQQQGDKIIATGAIGQSKQGSDVAISGDGNTILIAGPGDNNSKGAFWIFNRVGGMWMQREKVGDMQSISVAISVDGKTIAAYSPNLVNLQLGVAVFNRIGDSWTKQAVLTSAGSGISSPSIAVSADGNDVFLGTYTFEGDNVGGDNAPPPGNLPDLQVILKRQTEPGRSKMKPAN